MARILVVDDAQFMRTILVDMLSSKGNNIVGQAMNGHEAVSLYSSLLPDIVLMDLNMPEMDGMLALTKILQTDPSANIIVCSALGNKNMVIEAIKLGAKDFIVKPFDPIRVVEAIAKLVPQ